MVPENQKGNAAFPPQSPQREFATLRPFPEGDHHRFVQNDVPSTQGPSQLGSAPASSRVPGKPETRRPLHRPESNDAMRRIQSQRLSSTAGISLAGGDAANARFSVQAGGAA